MISSPLLAQLTSPKASSANSTNFAPGTGTQFPSGFTTETIVPRVQDYSSKFFSSNLKKMDSRSCMRSTPQQKIVTCSPPSVSWADGATERSPPKTNKTATVVPTPTPSREEPGHDGALVIVARRSPRLATPQQLASPPPIIIDQTIQ